jgi:hypothetical protein
VGGAEAEATVADWLRLLVILVEAIKTPLAILRLSELPRTYRDINAFAKEYLEAMATGYAGRAFSTKVVAAQDVVHAALERWFKASNVAQPRPGGGYSNLAFNDVTKEFIDIKKNRMDDWKNAPPTDKSELEGYILKLKDARKVCAHHSPDLNKAEDVEKALPVMFTEGFDMIRALSKVPDGDLREQLEGNGTKMGKMLVEHQLKDELHAIMVNSIKEKPGRTLGKRKAEEKEGGQGESEPTAAGALGNGGGAESKKHKADGPRGT